jgi:hypothetical protein
MGRLGFQVTAMYKQPIGLVRGSPYLLRGRWQQLPQLSILTPLLFTSPVLQPIHALRVSEPHAPLFVLRPPMPR